MPRPVESNVKQMDDAVIRCFIDPNGKEATTQAERREIAEQWCAGDYSHHLTLAHQRGLLPMALLIAALIDIDHPLLCSPRGVLYNSLKCSIIILNVMRSGQTVAQPVESSFNRQAVERIK